MKREFKMNNLLLNIFTHDTDCIIDLITHGFNVTHFERIHLESKAVLLVNVDALNGLDISSASVRKIEGALFAYYTDNQLEIIYRLPNRKAVKRIESWGMESDKRDLHKPYNCNIDANICRNAGRNAKLLAQYKAIINARITAANIAKECFDVAINGGNKRYFAADFSKIDNDELFACLKQLGYSCSQDANVSNTVIVQW